jgi:hypothetical protein
MPDLPAPLPGTDGVTKCPARPAAVCDPRSADENIFLELRRKVQESELLAAATERLLVKMRFNGRLTVVVHNGQVFKSAYEEGYFRRKNDLAGS